jgi:hypothetical protein
MAGQAMMSGPAAMSLQIVDHSPSNLQHSAQRTNGLVNPSRAEQRSACDGGVGIRNPAASIPERLTSRTTINTSP